MSHIPPSAYRLIMVDFDGTIVPWGPLMDPDKTPFSGVPGALHLAREHGFRIGIFTSRMSKTWAIAEVGEDDADEFLVNQLRYVERMLDTHAIPYDFVTAEKLPAEAYFDDKAIGVPHPGTLTGALIHFLNESARETA